MAKKAMPRWYARHLKKTVAILFDCVDEVCGWNDQETVDQAGLCFSTVHNLRYGITKNPQYLTVMKLATAVGLTTRDLEATYAMADSRALQFEDAA